MQWCRRSGSCADGKVRRTISIIEVAREVTESVHGVEMKDEKTLTLTSLEALCRVCGSRPPTLESCTSVIRNSNTLLCSCITSDCFDAPTYDRPAAHTQIFKGVIFVRNQIKKNKENMSYYTFF